MYIVVKKKYNIFLLYIHTCISKTMPTLLTTWTRRSPGRSTLGRQTRKRWPRPIGEQDHKAAGRTRMWRPRPPGKNGEKKWRKVSECLLTWNSGRPYIIGKLCGHIGVHVQRPHTDARTVLTYSLTTQKHNNGYAEAVRTDQGSRCTCATPGPCIIGKMCGHPRVANVCKIRSSRNKRQNKRATWPLVIFA